MKKTEAVCRNYRITGSCYAGKSEWLISEVFEILSLQPGEITLSLRTGVISVIGRGLTLELVGEQTAVIQGRIDALRFSEASK